MAGINRHSKLRAIQAEKAEAAVTTNTQMWQANRRILWKTNEVA
jgi:hypothetical protein